MLSDLGKYTTFKVRKELGDLVDQLIVKYRDKLGVLGMDNRSGFITFLCLELAKHEGLLESVDPELKRVYTQLFPGE